MSLADAAVETSENRFTGALLRYTKKDLVPFLKSLESWCLFGAFWKNARLEAKNVRLIT